MGGAHLRPHAQAGRRYDFWGAGRATPRSGTRSPENLYRAYLLTGDPLFKEFARRLALRGLLARLSRESTGRRRRFCRSTPTATSTRSPARPRPTPSPATPAICASASTATTSPSGTQCYATGGYGPDERLMPPDGSLGRSLDLYGRSRRDSLRHLGGVQALPLPDGLHRRGALRRLDRDAPLQRDRREPADGAGRQDLLLRRLPHLRRAEDALLARMAVLLRHLHAEHGRLPQHDLTPATSAGCPSTSSFPRRSTWQQDGQTMLLRQETSYPETETSTLTLDARAAGGLPPAPPRSGLVEGHAARCQRSLRLLPRQSLGSGPTIEREWQSGDTVTITMPMALRTVPVDRQHPDRAAIMYGPVVLAQDEACCRRPFAMAPTTGAHDAG